MPIVITFSPSGREAVVPAGTTILRAAQQAGVDVPATCGGRGRCRSCRVLVTDGAAPPATQADRLQLGDDEIRQGYRLACQAEVSEALGIRPAPDLADQALQVLTETIGLSSVADLSLDSGVAKVFLPASVVQRVATAGSTLDALRVATGAVGEISPGILRRLPSLARAGGGFTTALFHGEVIGVESDDTRGEMYGLALDIGTTTIVGYLVDLAAGTLAAAVAGSNPQAAYGADLMSRVAFAQEGPAHVRILQTRLLRRINALIGDVCDSARVQRDRIHKVVVAGNTVMHHTALGIDPSALGQAPFAPVVRESLLSRASDVGLRLAPSTPVCFLPVVAGFVGADAVAMILSTRLDRGRDVRIAADIGTNGEVVLALDDRLLACSAPAGPALEGGQIQCGMRAVAGAIDQVMFGVTVHCRVIGGGPPAGLCGSGVLDAVAGLLDIGLLEPSGRLQTAMPASAPDDLRRRVVVLPDGSPGFVLIWAGETATGRDIVLTQADIRQVQLAKAAIRSGMTVLQRMAGVSDDLIGELLLAGALGNYVSVHSAVRVGLIPALPRGRTTYVGNAAGLGAQMALVSETERRRAGELAHRVQHISVAEHPDFQDLFVDALRLE